MLEFDVAEISGFGEEHLTAVGPIAVPQHVRRGPIVKRVLPSSQHVPTLHYSIGIHFRGNCRGRVKYFDNVTNPPRIALSVKRHRILLRGIPVESRSAL